MELFENDIVELKHDPSRNLVREFLHDSELVNHTFMISRPIKSHDRLSYYVRAKKPDGTSFGWRESWGHTIYIREIVRILNRPNITNIREELFKI